jgi:tetratricopeptide (TPR) repeat protein
MRGTDGRSFILLGICLLVGLVGLRPLTVFGGDFDAASQAYDQGKFADAKRGYEALIGSGEGSANVYYDLGNAEFRLDSAGRAILNYERALALDPHHPEAKANLKLLRERTGAKLLPVSWNDKIAASQAPRTWTIVAAVSAWVALFGVVFAFTSRRESNLDIGFLSVLSLAVCFAALIALWSVARNQSLGVITAQEAQVRLAPAESAGVAAELPAGSQVRVLSERGAWTYCEMPDASRGWVPSEAVERVRPSQS